MSFIEYEQANQAKNEITSPATLTVTEADLYVVKNQTNLQMSQITVHGQVTLGGVASATFFYYVSTDAGTTWYPVSLINSVGGNATQYKVVVDSGTYASSGVSYFADSQPMAACNAFKVTGKAASGTPAYGITVYVRNN